MDNLLQAAPRDSFPLGDAYFEVDVQNDTVLDFYPFELSNGRRTQLTEFRLNSVNMTMQKMRSVLIHPDVDDIFAAKAAQAVERTLWATLSDSYADMMKVIVGNLRTEPVIT
ncbi:hypothetical protein MTO96_048051 [Rhipicephalus appendiculatus]